MPDNWRSSSEFGGNPGRDGAGPDNRVVINELLANSADGPSDRIELLNTSPVAVDLHHWYVSDSVNNLSKFQFTSPMSIPAGGYMTLDQEQLGFGLSGERGDDVWLVEANLTGQPIRFIDHVEFGATQEGQVLGRWPNGTGPLYRVATPTFGSANGEPIAGPLVISEIHYRTVDANPNDALTTADLEFVEITNISRSAVDVSGWRLAGGIDFTFPAATVLGPRESIVVVAFPPNDRLRLQQFRELHDDDNTRYLGPFEGRLNNGGDNLRLDFPDEVSTDGRGFVSYVSIDQVRYDDQSPWPLPTSENGSSLQRVTLAFPGNTPNNWFTEKPTPGRIADRPRLPGDANEDGIFNQLDIVQVLQAAKYLSDKPANWHDGDWTGDGFFDQQDIVAVLQADAYLKVFR